MATLALAVVGAAVGGALLPAGLSVLGATLTGAALGSQVGALTGSFIDQALLGASGQPLQQGPRLSNLRVMASTEGAPVPRLYGRARLGGHDAQIGEARALLQGLAGRPEQRLVDERSG